MKNVGILILTATFIFSARAASLSDVTLSDTIDVGGKSLKLNGLGRREATIFNVGVYVAGLYLETPSHSDQEILASKQVKRIEMHFLRKVEKEKIVEAFKASLPENCTVGCDKISAPLESLLIELGDMDKGEVLAFNILPDQVEVSVKGQRKDAIKSAEFAKAFLGIWLGPKPPNKSLKNGLLGNSKK